MYTYTVACMLCDSIMTVCLCVCVLYYTVHGREPLPTLDSHEVKEVRRELSQIRDKVNVILDSLDVKTDARGSAGTTTTKPYQQNSTPKPVTNVTKNEGQILPYRISLSLSHTHTHTLSLYLYIVHKYIFSLPISLTAEVVVPVVKPPVNNAAASMFDPLKTATDAAQSTCESHHTFPMTPLIKTPSSLHIYMYIVLF